MSQNPRAPRAWQDTVKTEELPAIPKIETPDSLEIETIRSDAFKTIQFNTSQLKEAELGVRKACEDALLVVLESLKIIERTPAYKSSETISIYKKEIAILIGILKDGEIGTESLIFHLNQKCQIIASMLMEFPNTYCIGDLKQSLKICSESKAKLEQKLKG